MQTYFETTVSCEKKEYKIVLEKGIISKVQNFINFDLYSKIFLLTESKIAKLWLHSILQFLPKNVIVIEVQSGESQKDLLICQEIWSKLLDNGCDRASLLINFGGGMISDLGGFIASLYMRGIDCINLPTTLLSMVDAGIGGKTAINFHHVKNSIGAFSSPSLVLMDINFLSTLEDREFLSAFSEAIKHAAIKDISYFEDITQKAVWSKNDEQFLFNLIKKSIEIKKELVEKDFEEKSTRKLLNFGHTIGHAFESASMLTDEPLLHGEAVCVGMFLEIKLSNLMKIASNADCMSIENVISRIFDINHFQKKAKGDVYSTVNLMKLIKKDKKNTFGKVKFSLPSSVGKALYDVEIPEYLISQILDDFLYKK